MFGKSIYEKLRDDFSFFKEFGLSYTKDFRHYVQPSVGFEKKDLKITIGYCYYDHEFFVVFTYLNKKMRYDKESLEELEKNDPESYERDKDGWPKEESILRGIILVGKTYQEQVPQVKEIVLKKLQEFESNQSNT